VKLVSLITCIVLCPSLGWAQAPAAAKPPILKPEHNGATIGYRLKVRPGVVDPGHTVSIEIELAQLLKDPDPTYGERKPIDDARLHAILVAPPAGKKAKGPTWTASHRAVRLSDAGTYGVTFTPPTAGVYGLYLRGDGGEAGPIEYNLAMPVGVWPLAGDATFPPLPQPEPAMQFGNWDHGKTVCAERCKKDHAAALPQGGLPVFLASDTVEALDDKALLAEMIDGGLDPMERADVLYYLRSLHIASRELFPEAAAILPHAFTINAHGKERLAEIKVKLEDAQASATVFTVFKGEKHEQLERVAYTDTVARDRFQKSDKLGYVVFLSLPGDAKAYELAIAVGLEPTYPIVKIVGRGKNGERDASFNKQLASFIGLGRFNDPKSLAKGPAGLREKLLPIYLRAAEFGTMYYADEREFTAFDSEFAPPPAEAPQQQVKLKNKR
jgi:hypothetical protein